MKITNAEVIKSGEKDLIDSITADLDWRAIEDIFLTEHNLGIDEDIEYKKGDIIAYENQVAYKLEFTVKVNLSVLINRNGEYISVNISKKREHEESINVQEEVNESDAEDHQEKDLMQRTGDPGASLQEPVASAADSQYETGRKDNEEDKYLNALEQLDSDETTERPGVITI
jgi:hypothetical protein